MSELTIAIIVGVVVLYVAFKILKFAIKMAFSLAVVAAGVAGYLTYVAT